jgi:vanillate O-demethylase monooxygenase subunit
MSAMLQHWHPVLLEDELGATPTALDVGGTQVVLFRVGEEVGALVDRCPHRGMRLSRGAVEGDRLVCPYHGWRWARDGRGESPSTPKMRPCATAFDVRREHGALWIRGKGSDLPFPAWQTEGLVDVGAMRHRFPAPLELVVDNFTEIEHTARVHVLLGYDEAALATVEVDVEARADEVEVRCAGPQKRLPWHVRALFGLTPSVTFHDDWVTRFSPVHTVYHQWWSTSEGARQGVRLIIAVFFTPVAGDETDVFTFTYVDSPWLRGPTAASARRYTRWLVDREVRCDQQMVAGLVDGMGHRIPGRLDGALTANRTLVARYRGL